MENEIKTNNTEVVEEKEIKPSNIKVRVFDLEHGLTEYEKIRYIRIKSKKYNLLIMQDYMQIIGEIEGSINIKGETTDLNIEKLEAYYVHHDNVFNLMIKDT